jgi:hypothetical protein
MAGKNTAVFGIYPNQASAEAAVETLRNSGFRNTDISVLFPDNEGTKDLAIEKETKAPEGATTGGISGGIIGGALGWLAGIGALAIPGIGPFIAAGPIVAMLSGVGVGGALGGFIGALTGFGIPEYEAKRFEGRIRKGGILLSVHCDNTDWTKRAKTLLEQTGAEDISSAGEAHADFAASERPLPRHGGVTPVSTVPAPPPPVTATSVAPPPVTTTYAPPVTGTVVPPPPPPVTANPAVPVTRLGEPVDVEEEYSTETGRPVRPTD